MSSQLEFDFVENKKKQNAIIYIDQNNIFRRFKKIHWVKLLQLLKDKYNIIRANSFNAIDTRSETQTKYVVYMASNGFKCHIDDIIEITNVDSAMSSEIIGDLYEIPQNEVIIAICCDGGYSAPLKRAASKGKRIHVIGAKDNTNLALLRICDSIDYIDDLGVVL